MSRRLKATSIELFSLTVFILVMGACPLANSHVGLGASQRYEGRMTDARLLSYGIAHTAKSSGIDASNNTWITYVHVPERFALSANASWDMKADDNGVTFYLHVQSTNEGFSSVRVEVTRGIAFKSLDEAVENMRIFCGSESKNTQSCSVSEPVQLKVGSADAYQFIIEEVFEYKNVRDVARRSIITLERASGEVYLATYSVFTETVRPPPPEKVPELARAIYEEYQDQATKSLSSLRFVVKTTISVEGVPKDLNPSVTVDGVPYSNLPIGSWLEHGSNHTLSVEPIVTGDSNTTRFSFREWSNGPSQTTQTVTIDPDDPKGLSYGAAYSTEYFLAVRSEMGTPEGEGWFQSGTATAVQVASSVPMSGMIGFLGARWVFNGWYDGEISVSNSSNAQIIVGKPYSLEARWSADYTIPTVVSVLVVVLASLTSVVCLVASRRKTLRKQAR